MRELLMRVKSPLLRFLCPWSGQGAVARVPGIAGIFCVICSNAQLLID